MENLQTALILMVVGMVTVFIILILIIQLGKLLIMFVNKYIPVDETQQKQPQTAAVSPEINSVVTETVKMITGGKGTVKNIEKI